MRKILSFALVIVCAFSLFSCSLLGGKSGEAVFESAISSTNPSRVVVEVVTHSALGDLNASYNVAYNEDGRAVITYSYEKFNKIGEGAENELKSTYSGTITKNADGTYSGTDVDVSSVASGISVKLSAINKDSKTINDAGDVLTANIAAADTEAVFGSAFSEDVDLEITIANGVVTLITLNYASGSVVCRYTA